MTNDEHHQICEQIRLETDHDKQLDIAKNSDDYYFLWSLAENQNQFEDVQFALIDNDKTNTYAFEHLAAKTKFESVQLKLVTSDYHIDYILASLNPHLTDIIKIKLINLGHYDHLRLNPYFGQETNPELLAKITEQKMLKVLDR